jgi:hypothetical protein
MKNLYSLVLLISFVCIGQNKIDADICWDGVINNKIPVFLHYTIQDDLVIGEITYLNPRGRKPIKLIGTIEDTNSYRLLEFDKKGNITGIIIATANSTELKGIWFSPKTNKEIPLLAKKNRKVTISTNYKANMNDIYGDYHYSYGDFLWNGDFSIDEDKAKNQFFELISVGKGEGPSIAQIERCKIKLNGNSFVYRMPNSENCKLKIVFFKDFVYVKDLGGDCTGEFGMGAYANGIYTKVK